MQPRTVAMLPQISLVVLALAGLLLHDVSAVEVRKSMKSMIRSSVNTHGSSMELFSDGGFVQRSEPTNRGVQKAVIDSQCDLEFPLGAPEQCECEHQAYGLVGEDVHCNSASQPIGKCGSKDEKTDLESCEKQCDALTGCRFVSWVADEGYGDMFSECETMAYVGRDIYQPDKAKHHLLLKLSECREAARRANITVPYNFELQDEWTDYHPQGCFKDECTHKPGEECYYFNPSMHIPRRCLKENINKTDDKPNVKIGTPVCKRPNFCNGTKHTVEAKHQGEVEAKHEGGCEPGYGVIYKEERCKEAGSCLGYCHDNDFRVTAHNQSNHNYYPDGCFIDPVSHCVRFNEPFERTDPAQWGPPANPGFYGGTELCEVSPATDLDPENS